MMAANAVQAALYARERRGAGQHIDISLLETHVSWLGNVASAYLMTGVTPQRMGNAHATIVPYQTFRAQHGEVALGVAKDGQWQRLCAIMARPDLAQDPRFATNPDRVNHRAVLIALLDAHFAAGRVDDWVNLAQQAGVPVGRVRTLPEVLSDPQVLHRDMIQTVEHPAIGELKLVGVPFRFSTDRASIRRAPPLLGEHTAEINALFPA